MPIKTSAFISMITILISASLGVVTATAGDEFPQNNAWYQATPSVVWCGDPELTTTLEVHVVERSDVARVWLGQEELFDDGTHGDVMAGDLTFTRSDVLIPCTVDSFLEHGWNNKMVFLRVELTDGQQIGNYYGLMIG